MTTKLFFLLLIPSQCRGCEVQSALLCNTLSSNHSSSHTRNLRSHNWKKAIPRYFAETGNKRKPSGMLKRTVKGLEFVQIKTPFLEIFLPVFLGTLGILVLLRTHIPYENSEMTMDRPSQQLILMSNEMQENESKSAFPTSNSVTSGVSALQLGQVWEHVACLSLVSIPETA